MSRTISKIYDEYKIMPTLREHMFRVAAVASLICDSFNEPLPKEEIISACLLHDMGNIIKFKLDYFPEFNKPEGLEYWQIVQGEYIEKYGDNEHEAIIKKMKELGLPKNIIELADSNQFSLLCRQRDAEDVSVKIIHYADSRVGPYGILSYRERMNDAKKRYENHKNLVHKEERQKLVACGEDMEKQIFSKCKIKPEDITDEAINLLILELKDFVIK